MRIVCFAFFLLFASVSFADERVLLQNLQSPDTVSTELKKTFKEQVRKGLSGAGFIEVSLEELEAIYKKHPRLQACNTLDCLIQIGALLSTGYVLEGDIAFEGNNYNFRLQLKTLPKGDILEEKAVCDICTLREASETLRLLAATLVGKTVQTHNRVFALSQPLGVQIFSQKTLLGTTPTILVLSPGAHKISWKLQGYQTSSSKIALEEKENLFLDQTMQKKRKPWLLLGGLGTLVIGILVGSILIFSGS